MNYDDALAWLTRFLEDVRYYEKNPSRRYLRDVVEKQPDSKSKVRILVGDGLVQELLYGDVLSSIDMHADALECFENHINITK